MAIVLKSTELERTLDAAYLMAIGDAELPAVWVHRSEELAQSPSVGFIAAFGAVLLAKATNEAIDAFVIQAKEGSAGAFNLRSAASALAAKKRVFGYDIGSSSDRDPINQGTLVSSSRWDVALGRIKAGHKPFFQLILTWLADVNRADQDEALAALAAYIRVRRSVSSSSAVEKVPSAVSHAPDLTKLIGVLEGFVAADPEEGARGMALVAAIYRTVGYEVALPSRNDPRPIDVRIKECGVMKIGAEVKQVPTGEATADSLGRAASEGEAEVALLAVLRPGVLVDFSRSSVILRVEQHDQVVLRVTDGVRELAHEALSGAAMPINRFCAELPRAFAEALRDIRASKASIETWAAIAGQWE